MTVLLSLLFAGSMTLEFRPAVILPGHPDDMRAQASIMPMEGTPR
jgi:hypothetical protein